MRELSEIAFTKATAILKAHRSVLDSTAARLLEKETRSAEELPVVEAFEAE